jgi:hypothetical protein
VGGELLNGESDFTSNLNEVRVVQSFELEIINVTPSKNGSKKSLKIPIE